MDDSWMIHGIIRFIYFYSFDAIDDFAKRDWHRHWMPDFEDLNTSFSEKIGVSAEIGGLAAKSSPYHRQSVNRSTWTT